MKTFIALLFCLLPIFIMAQGYGDTCSKQQLDSIKLAKQAEKNLQLNPGIYKSDILREKAGNSGQMALVCYAISGVVFAAGKMQESSDNSFDIKPYIYASGAIAAIGFISNARAWNLLKKSGIEGRKEKELILKTKGTGLALVYKF